MIEFDVTSARTRPLEPRVGMAYPICRACARRRDRSADRSVQLRFAASIASQSPHVRRWLLKRQQHQ